MSQGYVGTPGKSGSWEFELYLYILEMEDLKFVSTYFGLKLKTTMTYLYSNLSKALQSKPLKHHPHSMWTTMLTWGTGSSTTRIAIKV